MSVQNRLVGLRTRQNAVVAALVVAFVLLGGAWVSASPATEPTGSQLVMSLPHPTPAPPGP
jgi:hypothetical protein